MDKEKGTHTMPQEHKGMTPQGEAGAGQEQIQKKGFLEEMKLKVNLEG